MNLLKFLLFMKALLLYLMWQPLMLQAEPGYGARVGQKAPNFSLSDINQNPFRLADFRGQKPVYLVFWNTWCPPCRKKVPTLVQKQQALSEQIEILAINTSWDDSLAAINQFQQEFNSNYRIAWDDQAQITDLYQVWGTPTEFIIDTDGVIRYRDKIPADWRNHLSDWRNSQGLCQNNEESC